MTFECMVRAVPEDAVGRRGAVQRLGDGLGEGRKVVAATRVRPKLERKGGRAKRRKFEENRMNVGRDVDLYKNTDAEVVRETSGSMPLCSYH